MSDVNIIWKALRIWEAAIFEVSENLWVVLRSTCLRRIFLSRSDSTFDSCIFDGSGLFSSGICGWLWKILGRGTWLGLTRNTHFLWNMEIAGSTRCSVCHDVILLILLEAMQHPLVSTVDALYILHPTQGTIHPSNSTYSTTTFIHSAQAMLPQHSLWFAATVSMQLLKGIVPQFCFYWSNLIFWMDSNGVWYSTFWSEGSIKFIV